MIIQQGDVLFTKIGDIWERTLKKVNGSVIMRGEMTGHAHVLEKEQDAELFDVIDKSQKETDAEASFVKVKNQVRILHEEHNPVSLTKGWWKVTQVREFDYPNYHENNYENEFQMKERQEKERLEQIRRVRD